MISNTHSIPRMVLLGLVLTFGVGCSTVTRSVRVVPDGTWYDVYENRSGVIQRLLVTKKRIPSVTLKEAGWPSPCKAVDEHGKVRTTEVAIRERKVNRTDEYKILDPTDLTLDGSTKLLTLNPGSAVVVRSTQGCVTLQLLVDIKRAAFWPDESPRNQQGGHHDE